jgi:hypothetical protein
MFFNFVIFLILIICGASNYKIMSKSDFAYIFITKVQLFVTKVNGEFCPIKYGSMPQQTGCYSEQSTVAKCNPKFYFYSSSFECFIIFNIFVGFIESSFEYTLSYPLTK